MMKTWFVLIFLLGTGVVSAEEFRSWVNQTGVSADLKLLDAKIVGEETVGTFQMRNGQKVDLAASTLSEADAKALKDWVVAAAQAADKPVGGPPSVFDRALERNLVQLSGRSLRKLSDFQKPAKYYVFYYTASWCGPCQAFTPSLVDFYKRNKNENFEIILVSSDDNENAMEEYAVDKKMPWPHIKLDKARPFRGEFNHGVTGIPSLIVCDLEGKNLGNFRSKLDELKKMVK